MHSQLILIWEIVLIGFNSVWRISSHWKKIFSAAWEEAVGEYSYLLVTWNWGYAFQNKPNVTCKHGFMERRSCKIVASLHTKKQQACTNRPCLYSLVAQNLMFQPAVLLLLFQALAIFCGHMFSQPLLDLDQCSFSQLTVVIPALLMVCSKQEICICINEQNNSLSHRSVASRLIEWQRETQGHAPFLRTLAVRSVRSDARMLAPAKTRIGRGWDLKVHTWIYM